MTAKDLIEKLEAIPADTEIGIRDNDDINGEKFWIAFDIELIGIKKAGHYGDAPYYYHAEDGWEKQIIVLF